MNLEISLVLGILIVAFILFISERLRMDLVALLVLSVLALTGLVTPTQALAGFSNPAVITVWAMFILSSGLTNTGVAETCGRRLLGGLGGSETITMAVVMLSTGVMSAFMNNIGVAALMLPVVMNIARHKRIAPSRLLMPLAFGSLLGGLTTLIGTPPNLLASNALGEAGYPTFGMFDFAPVGGSVFLIGSAFVVLLGRRLLPRRDPARESSPRDGTNLRHLYEVDERTAVLRLPDNSALDGVALQHARLGVATGLNVYAIVRDDDVEVAPDPMRVLRSGDRLLVHGKLDRFEELRAWRKVVVQRRGIEISDLVSGDISLCEAKLPTGSPLLGQTVASADLRKETGVIVLAMRRGSQVLLSRLGHTRLSEGDSLFAYGDRESLEGLKQWGKLELEVDEPSNLVQRYGLQDYLFTVRVPEDSFLVGSSLRLSRLGDALGVGALALVRDGTVQPLPGTDELMQAGDELIVRGDPATLDIFNALQNLELEEEKSISDSVFEAEGVGLIEVMLSPRSGLVGRTLRELSFRERYGLGVLAVLRAGEVIHSNLGNTSIGLGDALLCVGTLDRTRLLQRDPDFIILNDVDEPPDFQRQKAPAATLIMASVVASVLLGLLPISIAAVAGATFMVLFGCLTMQQAYRAIEWRSVFLIAGMLPLGTAMEQSGAAGFLARGVVMALSPLGPWGIVGGLYLMTALLTSVVPTAALIVLVAPIVLDAAVRLELSEQALMMAVAMAASASFTSPISHPANVLVMGPGGYRFIDYVKLGVPLTLVVMVVVMLTLPFFWPLQP